MKNIIKTMVLIAIVAGMIFVLCGFAWNTEEGVDEALIAELEYEGFTRSETDENIWTIMMTADEFDVDDGYATAYARFDTEKNIGIVTIVGSWYEDGVEINYQSYVVQWNPETQDFDQIGTFDY